MSYRHLVLIDDDEEGQEIFMAALNDVSDAVTCHNLYLCTGCPASTYMGSISTRCYLSRNYGLWWLSGAEATSFFISKKAGNHISHIRKEVD